MTLKSFLKRFLPVGKSEADEDSDWSEKRRSSRTDLSHDDNLKLHLATTDSAFPSVTLVGWIRNVSMSGCRIHFDKKEHLKELHVGQVLNASIIVDGFSIPLQIETCRIVEEDVAAIRFKSPYPQELKKLERFLEPRTLGSSLREIDPKSLKTDTNNHMRWFHGINETSLFIWSHADNKEINQIQLIFLDQVVEWREGEKLKTGMIKQDTPNSQMSYGWVKSELMEFHPTPVPALLSEAKILMESSSIDLKVKCKFLEKL